MSEFVWQHNGLFSLIGGSLLICFGAVFACIHYAAYKVNSQILGKTVWHGNARNNSVALTFDDGPSLATPHILDVLREEGVKATFFLVGKAVEKYPEIARRIVSEGHTVGNHSYSHPIFLFCSARTTGQELKKTQELIENVTGVTPLIARPPCGVRSRAYFAAAQSLALRTVQWSVAGFDWKKLPAQRIAGRVLDSVKSDSIILLHDGDAAGKADRRATLEALPLILRGLREKELLVVPLAELMLEAEGERLNLHVQQSVI